MSTTTQIAGVDPNVPNPGRMYDYFLNGNDHFPADKEAGDKVMELVGQDLTRNLMRENRDFLGRAAQWLAAEHGIRQFIDLGSGLPNSDNTHSVVRKVDPSARVVYLESDGALVAHGKQLTAIDDGVAVIQGDMRNVDAFLANAEVRETLDFTQPIAVMLIAALHCVADEDDPWNLVTALRDACPEGSALVLSHLSAENTPRAEQESMFAAYEKAPYPLVFRDEAQIMSFFSGYQVQDPGVIPVGQWTPEGRVQADSLERIIGGVGLLTH